jgi:uncharacterized membrane protein
VSRPQHSDPPADASGPRAEGSAAAVAIREPAAPGPDRVVPSWVDPVARQASEAVGGPWGRHAVTGRALFWTPLRICLLLTTLVLALAWLKEVPCSDGNWPGHKQYTHACYTDAVPLFSVHGLDTGRVPYLDSPVEYPVLTGGFMELSAVVARGYDHLTQRFSLLPSVPPVQSYFAVTCLLLSLGALVVTRAVLALAGRRPWDAAMIGLSPLLLVEAFINWDLFAIALTTLAMWAWARRHPVLAGVLFGLGTAAKLYPVLLLGVLFVLCLRAGRLRSWWPAAAAAAGTWLVVNLPIALVAPHNWARFYSLSGSRPANPETLWKLALTVTHDRILDGPLAAGQPPHVLNAVVAVVLGLAAAGVAWLILAAPLRPRFPQVAFLMVAAFLEINKVWSPQYSLWLLPLLVLARPRWRSLLIWQVLEALVWLATMLYYLGSQNRGIEVQWFFTAVVARDLAVAVLMGLVVRDILRPDGDLVRTSWPGTDDPAGGVLDGAPDRCVLSRGVGARRVPARNDGAARRGGGTAPGRGATRSVAMS